MIAVAALAMSNFDMTWTTADEIRHVRRLAERASIAGDVTALRNYLHLCRTRNWSGAGMEVDPGQVILCIEDAIFHIETKAKLQRAEGLTNVLRKRLGLKPL